MIEKLLGWFFALCVISVVVAFFIDIVIIALSPFIGIAYLIADWYERKSSSDTQPASQGETEASLRESPKTHGS
ncbi:hypothetical protein SAMN06269117_12512 [Balnearium lithotrophicum]|uniref:Uncharacterized protein n=1 Tax=Balnearium lithotrophicum TaxID=223788 RepID=A0A521DS88_9BACT|nr:hypothetical protein [Balnearium lithotrophicum]SMO74613.1 hypothetical protein SAMN06269117_12512 [Balnearium lithotrophicum]